ncbi:MAG: site-2 protease family protein [Verrucomicrobia bacterium]|jgi:Zn-dependent protease|nr:site-2 protease family protein [Verrucomicrobiota bacterium]
MKWSLRLGSIVGINVYMHWTFLLLIGWIFFSHLAQGHNVAMATRGAAFIMAIFGCVVLHELGHALAARRYGIRTRDITLLPIGGVARLERMPEKPKQELVVALAGPAVNVVIAAILFVVLAVLGTLGNLLSLEFVGGSFLVNLMSVNVLLVVFNMLPAFPMDGGRVLRALLATRMDYRRATGIAASVGQGMAILFALAGLFVFKNPFLLFIALFVFLGAASEAETVGVQQTLRGQSVRDAMLTRFRTLAAEATLDDAVRELLAGSQQDFPVMSGDALVGILMRNDLVKAIAEGGRQALVKSAMRQNCAVVEASDPLRAAFDKIRRGECSTVPVLQEGRLVGLLTLENVGELVMVNEASSQFEGRT